jgi:hypothetical protein
MTFSEYQDLINLRFGEFRVNTETFDPIQLFEEFKWNNQNEEMVQIKIKNAETIPKRITGEKKRFFYLASQLLRKSMLRARVKPNESQAMNVKFSFVTGNLSEETLED